MISYFSSSVKVLYLFFFLCDYVILNEQAKQKQKGAARLVLPSVEGEEGGKWIVIDSGQCLSCRIPNAAVFNVFRTYILL